MGQLRYSGTTVLDIDDHTLAHFQVIVFRKLRLHESFVLPWCDEATGLRTTLWIHPQSDLVFSYTDEEPPQIDAVLVRTLQDHLDATGTLRLPRSPAAAPPAHTLGVIMDDLERGLVSQQRCR